MSSHSIPIDKKALRRALPSHSSCGRPQLKARPARTPRAVFMFCVSSQKMRSRDGSEQLKKSQATKSLKSGSTSYLHLCVVVVTEPANARSANATAVCVRCDLAKDRTLMSSAHCPAALIPLPQSHFTPTPQQKAYGAAPRAHLWPSCYVVIFAEDAQASHLHGVGLVQEGGVREVDA